MQTRFKERAKVIDIVITALAVMLSVGTMLYGIFHYGLAETWPELVLNVFYIACVVMIWLYFFDAGITTKQFNYWCTVCVGITVLLRDILFPHTIAYYPIKLACSTLSVILLCLLTYFYARKDWESYTKRNLWLIFIVDALIAILYNTFSTTSTFSLNLSTNSPRICSPKSGFVPPSPTGWWLVLYLKPKRKVIHHEKEKSFLLSCGSAGHCCASLGRFYGNGFGCHISQPATGIML